MLVVTSGVVALGGALSHEVHGGAWGFARVLRLEHAALRTSSIDAPRGTGIELLSAATESEVAWRGSSPCAARLRSYAATPTSHLACGSYAITGGLGGLGLRAASLLVTRARKHNCVINA